MTVVFDEMKAQEDDEEKKQAAEPIQGSLHTDPNAKAISTPLSKLDAASLADIESISTQSGLGKKLDTVIKHVRKLQNDDPGCKIVCKRS